MSHIYRTVRRSRTRKPMKRADADKKVALSRDALLSLFAAREMLIDAVFRVLHAVVPSAFASAFY